MRSMRTIYDRAGNPLLFFCLLCVLVFPGARTVFADDPHKSEGPVLESAENFFVFLKEKNYRAAWELLSERSQETIINDVYESARESGATIDKEKIVTDFSGSGIIFNNYWNAFMINFNPDIVLNERVWEFENIGPVRAIILIRGEGITRLIMYKEAGWWKVGFVETFWTRRPGKVTKFLRSLFINR